MAKLDSKQTKQTTPKPAAACPFCDPRDRILKENPSANVILSNPRKVPGHFLVTPKRHVTEPWELTTTELQDIFQLVHFVEQRLLAAGLGTGVDVRQNYRPFMKDGQLKVSHVHFHVIPRSLYDYIYKVCEKYDTELFAALDDLEAKEVAKILE